jgi:hypothetical protein
VGKPLSLLRELWTPLVPIVVAKCILPLHEIRKPITRIINYRYALQISTENKTGTFCKHKQKQTLDWPNCHHVTTSCGLWSLKIGERITLMCKTSRPTLKIGERITLMCKTSRPTWVIASHRQTTDFTPGYIAERAYREELLDLAGMMTSPTQ